MAGPSVGVDDVTVVVAYPAESITGFFQGWLDTWGLVLDSKAVMQLEQIPTYNGIGTCT